MKILTDKYRRKEWHKFFVSNKDRFTDSKIEAKLKNGIYVERILYYKGRYPWEATDIQYNGIMNY